MGPEGKKLAVSAYIELLKDKEGRFWTLLALARIGPEVKAAALALAGLLNDEEQPVAVMAAEILAEIGHQRYPQSRRCSGARIGRSGTAARVLERIGPEAQTVLPALVELLADKDSLVRYNAAEHLGEIGPNGKTALPALVKLFEDKS